MKDNADNLIGQTPEGSKATPTDPQEDLPLVSLIILTFNRTDYLKIALESALAQTYPNLEIIVSDNHSLVSPQTLVEAYNDPRVHFYRNPVNVGQTANYVVSVKKAHGKYVAFLHDDDKLAPDFITKMVAPFLDSPAVVLSFCDYYMMNAEDVIDYDLTERVINYYMNGFAEGNHKPFFQSGLIKRTISGMDTMFLREAVNWEAIPTDLPACCDLYMVYLCSLTGLGAYYIREKLLYYRTHSGQTSNSSALPRGMVACYEQFVSDKRLAEFRPELENELNKGRVLLAIAYIKENRPKEARRQLKLAFKKRIGLRGLAALVLSLLPGGWALRLINLYRDEKRHLGISEWKA